MLFDVARYAKMCNVAKQATYRVITKLLLMIFFIKLEYK